ncbi:MAG: IS5 family transposase [Gemmatimonadota bacterium]
MRGDDRFEGELFSYVSLEDRVPRHHPLRKIKKLVDKALKALDVDFERMYSDIGRPSIPPEFLVRASLLQVFYSIRSERMLMEQLNYNLLFRWFVGMSADERVWDASTFSKNRNRLVEADIGRAVFDEVVKHARRKKLTSDEHFSVDGTLIAAWASNKSVRRKDGGDDDNPDGKGRNAGRNFHGERRRNETHASRTDPEALLMRKGNTHPSRPSYQGHVLIENRQGLVVDAELTQATGRAERETALQMADRLAARSTLGADKAYDTREFVAELRSRGITPQVAQNTKRRGGSAIDGRTTRHESYAVSQRIRKRVEEPFGWGKTVGGIRQTKFRGVLRVRQQWLMTMAACNLVRMSKLCAT